MKLLVFLFLVCVTTTVYALPHNYDLPSNCVSSSSLTTIQNSKKSELEVLVIPAMKQLMKEAGEMSALIGVGLTNTNTELANCAIGYADYDAGERLKKGLPVLPLQANALARGASLAKPISRAAVKRCVELGLCSYTENAMTASGVVPWKGTTQTWHSQCTIANLVELNITGCNIPYDSEGADPDVASLTGYSLPLSFANRLSYDTSGNTPRVQSISNLGYMILGAIIENKTRRNYYDWVYENVLVRAGISKESFVQSLGTLQLKNQLGAVVNGREPGEMSYDGRDVNDVPDYRVSAYDGKTIARNPDAFLPENTQAAAGWTGTTDAWLKFASNYADDGSYAPSRGNLTASGEFFGTSTIMSSNINRKYSLYINFNRYSTVADGNIISTAALIKMVSVLNTIDSSGYTYNLWDTGTVADQVVVNYTFDKSGVFRYFAASPAATTVLDNAIAASPSTGFSRTGESWKMWRVGTPGTVPVCRYFYPPASTHFWGKYEDCKLVQMLFPNQENYIDTFHFEEMTLAAKLVNSNGTCDAPTVPLYRGFRSVNGAQNHQYVTNPGNINTARGYALEGIAFCVMPN